MERFAFLIPLIRPSKWIEWFDCDKLCITNESCWRDCNLTVNFFLSTGSNLARLPSSATIAGERVTWTASPACRCRAFPWLRRRPARDSWGPWLTSRQTLRPWFLPWSSTASMRSSVAVWTKWASIASVDRNVRSKTWRYFFLLVTCLKCDGWFPLFVCARLDQERLVTFS